MLVLVLVMKFVDKMTSNQFDSWKQLLTDEIPSSARALPFHMVSVPGHRLLTSEFNNLLVHN